MMSRVVFYTNSNINSMVINPKGAKVMVSENIGEG